MNKVIIFAIGAACGYIAARAIISKRLEQQMEREIHSVKEAFAARREARENTDGADSDEARAANVDKPDLKPALTDYYNERVREYTDYSADESGGEDIDEE